MYNFFLIFHPKYTSSSRIGFCENDCSRFYCCPDCNYFMRCAFAIFFAEVNYLVTLFSIFVDVFKLLKIEETCTFSDEASSKI
jgi:hypothetical protein